MNKDPNTHTAIASYEEWLLSDAATDWLTAFLAKPTAIFGTNWPADVTQVPNPW